MTEGELYRRAAIIIDIAMGTLPALVNRYGRRRASIEDPLGHWLGTEAIVDLVRAASRGDHLHPEDLT